MWVCSWPSGGMHSRGSSRDRLTSEESDWSARTGVRRQKPLGNDERDDREFPLSRTRPSPRVPDRSHIGPVARAAAEVVERMCDQAILNGRVAFAEMANVDITDVRFDRPGGQFLLPDGDRSCDILEIARNTRSGASARPIAATSLQRSDGHSSPERRHVPSAA